MIDADNAFRKLYKLKTVGIKNKDKQYNITFYLKIFTNLFSSRFHGICAFQILCNVKQTSNYIWSVDVDK